VVAENGIRPGSEYRCHPPPLAREQRARRYGVDAGVNPMKPSGAQPNRDRVPPESRLSQLTPGHDPVLSPCQFRQPPIVIASP
jgi:hypothetical protein